MIDLASDTAWIARIDEGAPRPIVVPGGGWNSDLQNPRIHIMNDVENYVDYERQVMVPREFVNQRIVLQLGAVNYGAEVYVDGCLVHTHAGSQIPFEVDLTPCLGGKCVFNLRVRAFHRRYYDRNGINLLPIGWEWPVGNAAPPWGWKHDAPVQLSKMGYGITKYIRIAIYPECYIKDVFVRPSVSSQSLSYDVWIYNGSSKDKEFCLQSSLSSWNGDAWEYPEIEDVKVEVKAGSLEKATIDNISWTLGPASYWWPNIPFDEMYRARLHWLHLKLDENGVACHTQAQRFGFCEHAEGKYYYMVNGVRVNGFGDGTAENQMSYYDCYSTASAFLPPTETTLGCPETWKRYMRIGFNCVRLHCSVPTQYMMDVADEQGFMLIPEAPIWGNKRHIYHPVYASQTIKAMVAFCRNHPSVARYSLTNEVREPMTEHWPWRGLIDAAYEVDPTRPLVYELHRYEAYDRIDGYRYGHAYIMDHYAPPVRTDNSYIRGMGEQFWGTNKMEEFATGVQQYRLYDYAYVAPWSWINYWPNFLEGMDHDRHAWTPNNHPDRRDGIDGWNSDVVRSVQFALHPFLIMDKGIQSGSLALPREINATEIPKEDTRAVRNEESLPVDTVAYQKQIQRQVEIFNGGLSDAFFSVKWEIKSSRNKTITKGETTPVYVKAGFHAPLKIDMGLDGGQAGQTYSVILQNMKDARPVCSIKYGIHLGEVAK